MTGTTETQVERATPAEWIARLEIFRERFRLGLMDANAFKNITRAFQFNDDLGHIWMPGATSNQWYRWDRTHWSAATPPAQLIASKIPASIALAWNRQVVAPIAIDSNPVRPEQPRVVEPAQLVSMDSTSVASPTTMLQATCPYCGQAYIAPARFCPNCGESLTSEKKSRRPTDLPERGVRVKPHKPTDLPR